MIIINFDFTTGNEISYLDGLDKQDDFETCVLDFFCATDYAINSDVIVRKKDGSFISRNKLMSNESNYTVKFMRNAHNIRKMLVANAFDFEKGLIIDKSKI